MTIVTPLFKSLLAKAYRFIYRAAAINVAMFALVSCGKSADTGKQFPLKMNCGTVNVDVVANGVVANGGYCDITELLSDKRKIEFIAGYEPLLELHFSKPALIDVMTISMSNPSPHYNKPIKLRIDILPDEKLAAFESIDYTLSGSSGIARIDFSRLDRRMLLLLKYKMATISLRSNEDLGLDVGRRIYINNFSIALKHGIAYKPSMDLASTYEKFELVDPTRSTYSIHQEKVFSDEAFANLIYYSLSGNAGAESFFLNLRFNKAEYNYYHTQLLSWYELNKNELKVRK